MDMHLLSQCGSMDNDSRDYAVSDFEEMASGSNPLKLKLPMLLVLTVGEIPTLPVEQPGQSG